MVMNLSLGIGFRLGIQSGYQDTYLNDHLLAPPFNALKATLEVPAMLLYLPVELSIYTRYHINKYSSVLFGLNIAGHFGAYNRLLYGFTFGFAF